MTVPFSHDRKNIQNAIRMFGGWDFESARLSYSKNTRILVALPILHDGIHLTFIDVWDFQILSIKFPNCSSGVLIASQLAWRWRNTSKDSTSHPASKCASVIQTPFLFKIPQLTTTRSKVPNNPAHLTASCWILLGNGRMQLAFASTGSGKSDFCFSRHT